MQWGESGGRVWDKAPHLQEGNPVRFQPKCLGKARQEVPPLSRKLHGCPWERYLPPGRIRCEKTGVPGSGTIV